MDRNVTNVEDFFDMLGRYDLRTRRGVGVTVIATDGTRHTTYLALE